jgi:ring-1,2-phenylacetyl-CoA epoxidase subunit PaaB
MNLYEVFIRAKSGLSHKHVGSVHATDEKMALQNARDLYTRREEGESIWIVDSRQIFSSNPSDKAAYFEPAEDKIYRHPSFYPFDKEVKNI